MKKYLIAASIFAATVLVMGDDGGCSETITSDQIAHQQQEKNLANAARDVGMPAITNYTEKRLLKQLYEMRDDPKIITYTYLQGIDGRLTFQQSATHQEGSQNNFMDLCVQYTEATTDPAKDMIRAAIRPAQECLCWAAAVG